MIKKLLVMMGILVAFSVSAFASSNIGGKKVLVAYFSLRNGNTYNVAKDIHDIVGGDIFRIETTTKYPSAYRGVTDQAKKEQNDNARPALVKNIDNIKDYDIIFVGYPNWWGTLPMVMFTFFETHDLKGKTIVPFVTHGGSAFGRSERDLKDLCKDSTILEGLAVSDSHTDNAKSDVEAWLKGLGFAK